MKKKIVNCEICGISSEIKNVGKFKQTGQILCEKHKLQYKKYGMFKDTSPRGVFDANEIRYFQEYAEIDTYDPYGTVVCTYKFDLDEMEKLNGKKWRTVFKNDKPYLFTGNQTSERVYFHRLVLVTDKQVDHISGDTSDNRKENLREVTVQENMMNLKPKKSCISGFRGVSYDKARNNWKIDFTWCKQRIYLKAVPLKEEAVFLRYLCETNFNKERRNTSNDIQFLEEINKLSNSRKKELLLYFNEKTNTLKEGV